MTTATVLMENATQPDEGNPWHNTLSFLSEAEHKAAEALVECGAAYQCIVVVYADKGDHPKIAQTEYSKGHKFEVYDQRPAQDLD